MKRSNSKQIPEDVISYIEEHEINKIVKKAFNKVIRLKPSDPLSALAGSLIDNSKKSYPVFKRFEARSIFLQDSAAL